MIRALALALACAAPAMADTRATADALIDLAVQEHIVIANCIEQDAQTLDLMRTLLPGDFSSAAPELLALGYTQAEIDDLIARTAFDSLLLPDDTPVGDLRALCAANDGWRSRHRNMQNVLLRDELRQLIDAQ